MDFKALFAEYTAATTRVGLVDASSRELLAVTGPDRASFLQGMCTQDIEALTGSQAAYTAFLTAKGAMVADARVIARPDALWLDVEPHLAEPLKSVLSKFLISEDAELHNLTSEWSLLRLLGPQAHEVKLPEEAVTVSSWLPSFPGVDVWLPKARFQDTFSALENQALPRVSQSVWNMLRIEQGVPRFGVDMTETTIPLEASLERAISYQKGCYIGQEVIARATFRGQMNKKLMGLLVPSEFPSGTELFVAEKKVGWMTSTTFSFKKNRMISLGYVHRDHLAEGSVLTIQSGESVTVCGLPF